MPAEKRWAGERMGYRIAICDDERSQAEELRALVLAWGKDTGADCAVEIFASAESFLFAREGGGVFDILLLDVEMSGMSGLELARRLRADGDHAQLAFITSHFEFVAEGYEVEALNYLVKPVTREKLFAVLSRAAERLAVEPPYVLAASDGETVKLYESEILYVESFLHELVIHAKGREYRVREPISAFEERLSADFFRVHRSYLVNLKAVRRIGRTSVALEGGAEVPVARGKYDDINRAFIARN